MVLKGVIDFCQMFWIGWVYEGVKVFCHERSVMYIEDTKPYIEHETLNRANGDKKSVVKILKPKYVRGY